MTPFLARSVAVVVVTVLMLAAIVGCSREPRWRRDTTARCTRHTSRTRRAIAPFAG